MNRKSKRIFRTRPKAVSGKGAGNRLRPVAIRRFTGFLPDSWREVVPRLRNGKYCVDTGTSIGGDAPKNFIGVYTPSLGSRRGDQNSWPRYIAKVGHQFYPAESTTEQMMTRVGQLCGLDIAASRLMECAGQIRFLSRYFLRRDEILNHGADLLGRFLEDKEFVAGVAEDRLEREMFTFDDFRRAIEKIFPDQAEPILKGFVRMIGFDALVGNQDRHLYNWGIITHLTGARPARFSPIYDTARGLFWNTTERGLMRYQTADALEAYIRRSTPQIGWTSARKGLNHFELVERVALQDSRFCEWLEELRDDAFNAQEKCDGMVDAEFVHLMSDQRRDLIRKCLRLRFAKFAQVF